MDHDLSKISSQSGALASVPMDVEACLRVEIASLTHALSDASTEINSLKSRINTNKLEIASLKADKDKWFLIGTEYEDLSIKMIEMMLEKVNKD